MINFARVLEGKPIHVVGSLFFYQPTLEEIVEKGEDKYWGACNLWCLRRKDMIAEEDENSAKLSDFEVWKYLCLNSKEMREALSGSCNLFLRSKIEFFDISGTIYIGEKKSGVILDEALYNTMRQLCGYITPKSSASDEGDQYQETEHMSEKERKLIEKMKKSAKLLEDSKNDKGLAPDEMLGDRILGLVAIGSYTFEQVYNMTMLQFNKLLEKYISIQAFELRTNLSPYMDSSDGQENKFWLN